MTDVEALIADILASGLGRAEGILFPAQRAVAAPIFDHQERIVAVISMTTIGDNDDFSEGSDNVARLRRVAAEASAEPAQRESYMKASSEDTVRSRSFTGKTARMLKNEWTEAWERPDTPDPLPMPLSLSYQKPPDHQHLFQVKMKYHWLH